MCLQGDDNKMSNSLLNVADEAKEPIIILIHLLLGVFCSSFMILHISAIFDLLRIAFT